MMTSNTEYITAIIEKLGTPILAAIGEVGMRPVLTGQTTELPKPTQLAADMAKLLTVITKLSLDIQKTCDIGQQDKDGSSDADRISLAAVLGAFVSSQYQIQGKVPTDESLKKLEDSFKTLSEFANNFEDRSGGAEALKTLDNAGLSPDNSVQDTHILTLHAITPVVNAVASFPFGQNPDDLLRDILEKLQSYTDEVVIEFESEDNGKINKTGRIGILKSLGLLYSQCHFTEIAKMMNAQNKSASAPTLAPVWKAFELRLDMLKILGLELFGTETGSIENSKSVETAQNDIGEAEEKTPAETQVETKADTTDIVAQEDTDEATPPSNDNPMAFFAKKKNSG